MAKRLADDAKLLLAEAQTPAGKAVIGGVVRVMGLVALEWHPAQGWER